MRVSLPTSLDDAVALLAEEPERQVLAGGTDLMVEVNYGHRRLETVLGLRRIDELRAVRRDGPDLVMGAGATYSSMLSGIVAETLPALSQAARTVGSPQIRNTATIGGNVATGSPAGDTLPVLSALDATIELISAGHERTLSIHDFLLGPKRTALAAGELIRNIRVRVPDGPQEFLKIGTRNAMVISVANCAVVTDLATATVRCGLGSVGPTPLRCPAAELAVSRRVDWSTMTVDDVSAYDEFGALVSEAAQAIDDHRSTAAYRTHAVGVLASRALARCLSVEGAP